MTLPRLGITQVWSSPICKKKFTNDPLLRGPGPPPSPSIKNVPSLSPFETEPYSMVRSVEFQSVDNRAILYYAQARRIHPLNKQINFWNRFTFLNKHLIFLNSLKESFSGILVNISNCRAFSPFEIVSGSRIRNVNFPSCRQPSDIKSWLH